jgi:hypothetical protein
MIMDATIKQTRIGAGAADTIADYEVIRPAAGAAVLQFEGMHRLAPDNTDALFMLCRGWAGWGYGFAQDDYEVATLAGDDAAAEYHKKRTKLAYDRSISYGLELLSKTDEGFPKAKKNADTLHKWLKENFDDEEDAEPLFWLGSAWLARVNLLKDEPEWVAEAFVGVEILKHSAALNPSFESWGATSTIAAYNAGVGSVDEAKRLLDMVLEKTKRKALGVQLNYAGYACSTANQALYEKMMNEILAADDTGTDPNLRLENAIAKRRAKRGLTKGAMEACSFPPPATPSPAPASK